MVFSAVEGAVVAGGLGALGAALYGIGLPKDSVINYEATLKANGFLIVADGSAEEMERARTILTASSPSSVDLHEDVAATSGGHANHPVAA